MSGIVELLGEKLLSSDGEIDTSSLKFKKDEVLGLYFSGYWCPPCKRFTPWLVEFYKNLNKSGSKMKIVFVSTDRNEADFDEYFKEMCWYALPYSEREKEQELGSLCKVSEIPSLHLFNSEGTKMETDRRPRFLVAEDPEGKDFPWPNKTITELLSGKIVDKDGNKSTFEELRNGGYTIGIYFSAPWCHQSRDFTPQLVETYKKVQQKGHKFEIVFASSDEYEDGDVRFTLNFEDMIGFQEYFETMPWKAIPMGDRRIESLNERFKVDGTPTLVILDSEGNIITSDARSRIGSDKNGDEFPWRPKPANFFSQPDGNQEEVNKTGDDLLVPVSEKFDKDAHTRKDGSKMPFVTVGNDNDAKSCNRIRENEMSDSEDSSASSGDSDVSISEFGCSPYSFEPEYYELEMPADEVQPVSDDIAVESRLDDADCLSGLVELLGEKLLSSDGEIDTSSLKFEKDEILGLYFSGYWCPPCRIFTPKLVEFYKNLNKSGSKMKIVFVSTDRNEADFDEYFKEMCWYALPYSERKKEQALASWCEVSGIPSLHFFNSEGSKMETDRKPSFLVTEDPEGKDFPWPKKTITELLSGKIVDKDGNESTIEELRNGGYTIGIYFSAHWCPGSRDFTTQLVKTYKKIQRKGHKFEIILAPSPSSDEDEYDNDFFYSAFDKEEVNFKEYFDMMPWKAIPMGDRRIESLKERFKVNGTPTLVILDSKGTIITSDACFRIENDKKGNEFPWRPKPVNFFSHAEVYKYLLLIIYMDGSEEEVKEIYNKLLVPVSEKFRKDAETRNDGRKMLFVTTGGDNAAKSCNRIREYANLPKMDEKPSLLVIMNKPEGKIYVHEGTVETASDVQAIVDDFMAKKLTLRNLT